MQVSLIVMVGSGLILEEAKNVCSNYVINRLAEAN